MERYKDVDSNRGVAERNLMVSRQHLGLASKPYRKEALNKLGISVFTCNRGLIEGATSFSCV